MLLLCGCSGSGVPLRADREAASETTAGRRSVPSVAPPARAASTASRRAWRSSPDERSGLAGVALAASLPALPRPGAYRDLVGLTSAELVRLFGLPSLQRREPSAEVWQYARADCVLFLFLYRPRPGAEWQVQHVEGRQRGSDRPAGEDCIAGLLERPAVPVRG